MKLFFLKNFLLMVLIGQIASAQNARPDSLATLDQIAQKMQSGIYERIINLGYIPSPNKYRRNFTPQAHNEFTLLFFRFFAFEPTSDRRAYIGKLFMSERYLESHYNKKYTNRRAYKDDKDGFFMACKLYFDERSLEYRLNVYPEYMLNICRREMHYNAHRCTSTEQHWKSIKYVAQLADRNFDNFSQRDNTDSTKAFLNTLDPHINIRQVSNWVEPPSDEEDTMVYNPSFAGRNIIRTINLQKQIKIFKVGFIDEPNIGQTLTLKLTKYPFSEDLIEGTEYMYNFIDSDGLNDSELAKRGQLGYFTSRNPLYRSLIISREPDDQFVPGIDIHKQLQLAYPLKNEYYKLISKDYKDNGVSSTNKLSKQDSTFKSIQKKADSLKTDVVALDQEDRILISSNTNRSTFWVYGGREGAPEKLPKKGGILQLQGSQYLRDTIPIPMDSLKRLWLKGKISFWMLNSLIELNDSTDICLIDPGDKKVRWRVESIRLVPEQSSAPRHVWIQIVSVSDDNLLKGRHYKKVSSSNRRD